MKILVLENEPSSQRGGQEWSLLETCSGLAQRGHEIHFVYREDGDLLKSYQEFCKSLTKVQRYLVNNKGRRSDKLVSWIVWLGSILYTLKISPDVIYVNQSKDTFFGGTIAQIQRIPLVCHLRLFPPKKFNPQIRSRLKSVTRFISVSEATRVAYIRAGFDPKTIEVVYNGIDLERFTLKDDRNQTRLALGVPIKAFVVMYAGRIDRPKNVEMLLQAFAQLSMNAEQARLLIVGSPVVHPTPKAGDDYVQELKNLCEHLNISDSVSWLGRRMALPELFRAADVSVLPSLLPDTFGRVIVESMACGTPALGLRFGGIPEVLAGEFERFQIEIGDVSGLANQLRSLRDWQQNDLTLAQRCRAYAEERFSKEQSVAAIERVLQQAVEIGAVQLGPSVEKLKAWENEVSSNPEALIGFVTQ